jgi:hypothetical protein
MVKASSVPMETSSSRMLIGSNPAMTQATEPVQDCGTWGPEFRVHLEEIFGSSPRWPW